MNNLKELNNVFCQFHPQHNIHFIKLSLEKAAELKCDECILNESYKKDLISIQTIRFCQDDHIFMNWPPLSNNELLKEIKELVTMNSIIIEQIESEFDKISKQITTYLLSEKKKMIQRALRFSEQVEEITQSYQKIADINKLKEHINFNQENIQSQINKLQSFVNKLMKQKDQNTTILQEHLNSIYDEQNKNDIFYHQVQSQIQEQINNFINNFKQVIPCRQHNHIYMLYDKAIISNNCAIEYKKDLQKMLIKKDNLIGSGELYFNYDLTKNKKYIVRFKFNDEAGNCFNIGLMNKSKIFNSLSNNHLAKAFGNSYTTYSSKVVKGSHFYLVKKDLIVEMRINISEQKLQFLDYPNQANINELNDDYKSSLKPDDTYHLAIQFISNNTYTTCIDLIYFEEIQI
ncbi:hypothetical protein ABPG74_002621 [Tetrahymena malaccensis]